MINELKELTLTGPLEAQVAVLDEVSKTEGWTRDRGWERGLRSRHRENMQVEAVVLCRPPDENTPSVRITFRIEGDTSELASIISVGAGEPKLEPSTHNAIVDEVQHLLEQAATGQDVTVCE